MAEGRRRRIAVLVVLLVAALGLLGASARPDDPDWPTAVEQWDLDLGSGEPSAANVDTLVTAIAAATAHGHDDNGYPPHQLPKLAAKQGQVTLTCSYVSLWVVHEARELGWDARLVQTLTLDEWDGVNDGHSMVEVLVDGEWELYGVDLGVTVHDAESGEQLNLHEWWPRIATGDYELRPFDPTPAVTDEGDLRGRYERVVQWPLISDGTAGWYLDDGSAAADRVGSYSDRYQPERDWVGRFYSSSA